MTLIYISLLLLVLFFVITNLPVFGRLPTGERLKRIKQLSNYRDGAIQNFSPTPMQPEGISMFTILKAFLFEKNPNRIPSKALQHIKPELTAVNASGVPEVIWFGHSSYLITTPQYRILVDPVFSQRPSPFSFIGSKAFPGTDFIQAEDFSALDILLITHDHYDHLDFDTVVKLAGRTKKIVCSLGVGAHLEKWGIPADKITELAWQESASPLENLKFTAVPARHFTGRKFKRNQTLWSAFVLETAGVKLFLGGDSGYDTHFEAIGKEFGPFDLAILECGQYNAYWPYIHMFPEQTVQAAKDLGAKVLMPVHWGKFSLAMHNWDEPVLRVTQAAEAAGMPITTPRLGEKMIINGNYPHEKWWLD